MILLLLWCLLCLPCSAWASLLYDGVDARVVTPATTGAPTSYPYAVVAVVRFTTANAWRVIMQSGNWAASNGHVFALADNNVMRIYNSGAGLELRSAGGIPSNIWVLLGFTSLSATSHRLYAYNLETRSIILNEASSANLGAITAPVASIKLGMGEGGGSVYVDFSVQELRWVAAYAADFTLQAGDRFLSTGLFGPYASATPTALWSFTEAAGTTVYEHRGTGNHGTLTNFPATPWVPLALPGPYLLP